MLNRVTKLTKSGLKWAIFQSAPVPSSCFFPSIHHYSSWQDFVCYLHTMFLLTIHMCFVDVSIYIPWRSFTMTSIEYETCGNYQLGLSINNFSCNMSLQVDFPHSHLDYFPKILVLSIIILPYRSTVVKRDIRK